jgi:hypothetical protein
MPRGENAVTEHCFYPSDPNRRCQGQPRLALVLNAAALLGAASAAPISAAPGDAPVALLGEPPSLDPNHDYGLHVFDIAEAEAARLAGRAEYWIDDRVWITMRYSTFGTTVEADFREHSKIPQTFLDNLLWRAKRQWHRWFPE